MSSAKWRPYVSAFRMTRRYGRYTSTSSIIESWEDCYQVPINSWKDTEYNLLYSIIENLSDARNISTNLRECNFGDRM